VGERERTDPGCLFFTLALTLTLSSGAFNFTQSLYLLSILINPVMFDFGKLTVYREAKSFNAGIREFIKATRLDNTTNDQL
jgi:hypothetical protein